MSRKGMYKKAVEYYMPPSQTQTIYSDYKGPNTSNNTKIYERYMSNISEKSYHEPKPNHNDPKPNHNHQHNHPKPNHQHNHPKPNHQHNHPEPNHNHPTPKNTHLNMTWKTDTYTNLKDPRVWGPAFWFSLHNMSFNYPVKASYIVKSRTKNFILALPILLPCPTCKIEATKHIEKQEDLDDVCSGRDKLSRFFVDFHNKVRKRQQKSQMEYDEAFKMYNDGINVSYMTYE